MLTHQPWPLRPNVLLIITDQQRADAVGYVNKTVITPHLNILASKSIICQLAITQSPQCQPSRASLFTGRYPTAHRVWWNGIDLPTTERTLGNYLASVGYTTGYFGKIHFTPDQRHFGFEKSFLFEDWQKFIVPHKTARTEFYGPMSSPTWTGSITHQALQHDEIITDKAIEFMSTSRRPYLSVVGFHGPHPPYAAPDLYSKLYDPNAMAVPQQSPPTLTGHVLSPDDWRAIKVQYYGAVSWIDACIGRLLAATGDDTIIVFTSDHGDILGDHGLFSKGLFAYDGVIRVPLLFKLPERHPMSYQYLVQSIDILPTILDAIGMSIPVAVQGRSLIQAFDGSIVNISAVSMIGHTPRLRMVRTLKHKYWLCGNDEVLFDLTVDPGENHQLNDADVRANMRLLLAQTLIKCEDPLPVPIC